MSLVVLSGQPQSKSTELESMLYSMLYAAIKGRSHWGAYLHTDSTAHDAKLVATVVDDEFETVVVSRIDDRLLKCENTYVLCSLGMGNACKAYRSRILLLQLIKARM